MAESAWAGMPEQQMVQKAVVPHTDDPAHALMHWLGDYFGYGTMLLAIGLGLTVIWRKKLKRWFE